MRPFLILVAIALGFATASRSASETTPSVAAFDHLAIYVRDVDKSAAFYEDLFNLRQVPAPVPFARWLVLGNGMMLHLVGGRSVPVNNSRWDHFALTYSDLNAFIARLDAKGIIWSDLQGRPKAQTGIRGKDIKQIFLQDPDGYWIEVNDAPTIAQGR